MVSHARMEQHATRRLAPFWSDADNSLHLKLVRSTRASRFAAIVNVQTDRRRPGRRSCNVQVT